MVVRFAIQFTKLRARKIAWVCLMDFRRPQRVEGTRLAADSSNALATARTAIFACEGDFWAIGYAESRFPVRDLKGLRYLQHLLRYPNQEFHSLELLSGTATSDAAQMRQDSESNASRLRGEWIPTHRPSDSGPMLDDRARAAYKQKLIELKEELEDRRERGDDEGAERIQFEIEAIAAELTRATGLGGRVRRMGSVSERARLNVSRAIRSALAIISENNPAFARILDRDIRTGTFCEYVPAQSDPIEWQFSAAEGQSHTNIAPPRHDREAFGTRGFNWVRDSSPFIGRDRQRAILARNLELAEIRKRADHHDKWRSWSGENSTLAGILRRGIKGWVSCDGRKLLRRRRCGSIRSIH